MSNFWENDDRVSEYELIEETLEEAVQEVPIYEAEDIDDNVLEDIVEEAAFDLSQQQAVTVYNARLRLEQANLYEMLINHNLFDGVEANPQAIKNVQDELKTYIVARLEILLGIREPKMQRRSTEVVDERLNDVEIGFLKALAYKGTKGASGSPEEVSEPIARPIKKNVIKPLTQKKQIKKPLATPSAAVKSSPIKEEPLMPTKKVAKKRTSTNQKRKAIKKTSKKNMTLEEIAKKDLEELKKRKPWAKMTAKEKAAEVARVNKKYTPKPRPKNAIPLLSEAQLTSKYMSEEQIRGSRGSDLQKINSTIAAAIAARKINQGDY